MASHFSRGKLIAGFLAASLTACAAPAPNVTPMPALPEMEKTAAPAEAYRPEDLPRLELSDEVLIRILVGDVAAQRGEFPLAFQTWMDVVEKTRDPRAARRAVEIAVGSGRVDEAIVAAKYWADLAPKTDLPRQLLLALLIRSNRIVEAEPYLIALLEQEPEKIGPALLQLPRLWQEGSDRSAVLQIHEKMAARYPQVPEAHYILAVALAWQERKEDAVQALDTALKLRPGWEMALAYKAQLLKPVDRIAFIKAQDKSWRESRAALLLLAGAALEAGQDVEARRDYEVVLQRWPDDLEALTGAGLLAQQLGDYVRSDQLFKAALALNPANADYLRAYLGQSAEMQLRYREALAWYRQIGADISMKVQARIARLQARLGLRDEAMGSVAAMPENSQQEKLDKIQTQAQVLRELKDYQAAMRVLNAAIVAMPESYDLLLERSLTADFTGDHALVESDLRRYLQKFPDDASALNALGYVLANRTERLAEAENLIGRAIQSDPQNPAYIDSLGWLRYRQGRLVEARDLLAQAHTRFPDPEVSAHYTEVLWFSGEKAHARSILDAALKLTPDDDGLLALKKKLGL